MTVARTGRVEPSSATGRQAVTVREAIAAARARVAADRKRGVATEQRIVALARRTST